MERSLRQVFSEYLGAIKVDMANLRTRFVSLNVDQHPHHPWQRSFNIDFRSANQRKIPDGK
jgi:hypothetical protein